VNAGKRNFPTQVAVPPTLPPDPGPVHRPASLLGNSGCRRVILHSNRFRCCPTTLARPHPILVVPGRSVPIKDLSNIRLYCTDLLPQRRCDGVCGAILGVVMGGAITPDYKQFTRRTELRGRQCCAPEVVVGASAVGFGKGFRGMTDLELARLACIAITSSAQSNGPNLVLIQAGEGFSNAVIILSPITVHHSIFHLNPPAPNHPYLWPAFLRLITLPSQHHPRTWTLHSSARKIYLWKRGSVVLSPLRLYLRSPAF